MPTQTYRTSSGIVVPSVTKVLDAVIAKPALIRWANREGLAGRTLEQAKAVAADVGTYVHALIQEYTSGRRLPMDLPSLDADQSTQAALSYVSFLDWWHSQNLTVIGTEVPLVSEEYHYGGTIDTLARLADGDLTIIDYKTSKSIYDEYIYQVGGYYVLARENGYDVWSATIVRIPKEGGRPEILMLGENMLDGGAAVFLSALQTWRGQREVERLRKGLERGP